VVVPAFCAIAERIRASEPDLEPGHSPGQCDKVRQVLIPAKTAAKLLANRADAPGSAPVFGSIRRPGQPPTNRAVNYIVKAAAEVRWRQPGCIGALVAACPRVTMQSTTAHLSSWCRDARARRLIVRQPSSN